MIEVSHITKKYGDHRAVDDLSFHAEKGKIYGFLGPNGAGKTTTMNIMTGYLAATSGSVKIDDFDILTDPEEAKSRIGYLPEIPPVYSDMTVEEYLNFAAELKRVPKEKRHDAVEKAMNQTDVLSMRSRLIRNLSKGYRQRVGLAQAVINDPEIIILDEPTVGLDPEQQNEMFDYIRNLRENHIVILSSHILSDISAVCDFVWIINNGKLIASDTPENLQHRMTTEQEVRITVGGGTSERLKAVLIGMKGISDFDIDAASPEDGISAVVRSESKEDFREELSNSVFHAGMYFLRMQKMEKSLEDVFLSLTSEDGGSGKPAESAGEESAAGDDTEDESEESSGESSAEDMSEESAAGEDTDSEDKEGADDAGNN